MFGNQSGNNNKLKLKNARLIGANGSASNNVSDEDYSDYVVKNDIPEMKLLPMDYVHKAIKPTCAPPPPPPKCKCAPVDAPKSPIQKVSISEPMAMEKNPSAKSSAAKYLVYKRKHSIFGTTAPDATEKLQYVSGNNKKAVEINTSDPPKAKENRKKYLIFDSKKSSSKLDSIQYYFDNKSYEKHVDNKLYGKINRSLTPEPTKKDEADLMKGFENSRSWEYRDNSKTETKLKLFESKLEPQKTWTAKSDGSTSGASSCSEISLKRRNCRLKPHQKFTTSKSISDLSDKTSHDVSRINQLFANAKPQPTALRPNFEREKYKVHRKLNGDSIKSSNSVENIADVHEGKNLTKDNLKNYHRSSTELNIKTPATAAQSSCGFKNCKFSNCPVSNNSASSVVSAPVNEQPRRSKFDENFIKKFEDMKKNSNAAPRNNEITVNNKASISVNGKSNIIINDTKNHFTPSAHDVFIIDNNNKLPGKEREFHSKPNNQNKTTIKINDSCFVVNHGNEVKINNEEKSRNIIELNSEKTTNWDKNIKVKNNPLTKCDNKIDVNNKIRNEENSVKIYVSGNDSSSPTPSTTLSHSSSHESSDSDYGYFDTSSQGRSSSPEFAEMFKRFRQMCNVNSKPLGCDGTMFWNNSFFSDDETDLMMTALNKKTEKKAAAPLYACTKCHTTTDDLLSNYICICRNQVIMRFMFHRCWLMRETAGIVPRSCNYRVGKTLSLTSTHAPYNQIKVIKITFSPPRSSLRNEGK